MTKNIVSGKRIFTVLFTGILAISLGSILVRLTDDVHPIMISTYRLLFSSIILLPLIKIKKLNIRGLSKNEWFLCGLSGIFLALHFITWISSLQYTTVANSVVLVTMSPVFVGLFSYILLKEKLSLNLVIGIILSIVGSLILTYSGISDTISTVPDSKPLLGNLLALSGALMFSFYILIGSKIREKKDLLTYITVVYTIAAIVLVFISFLLALPFTGYKTSSYIYMLLLAILPQIVGHSSFNWALKHIKSSMVAITTMGEPVGATILAYFIFKETLTLWQISGIFLIFTAIFLASQKSSKRL